MRGASENLFIRFLLGPSVAFICMAATFGARNDDSISYLHVHQVYCRIIKLLLTDSRCTSFVPKSLDAVWQVAPQMNPKENALFKERHFLFLVLSFFVTGKHIVNQGTPVK